MTDGDSLLRQVQRDLLAGQPLPDLLRKCLLLGSESGSSELRAWATLELRGYEDLEQLPPYRKVPAQIRADATAGNTWITGQTIGWSMLPDFARENLSERVPLFHGVGHLQSLYESAASSDSNPQLTLPGWEYIARAMDRASGNPFQQTHALYWVISPSVIAGVLDDVRTAMTELLAELGAVMPATQETPTADQATQALHIAVSGGQPHFHVATSITAPRASGGSTIDGTSGGQSGAAAGDVVQRLGVTASADGGLRAWLDEYRAALPELDDAVRQVAEQQLDQVAAEIDKPEPHPVVVNSLLGSLKTFATNATAAAGAGAGTMGLAQVVANWPF